MTHPDGETNGSLMIWSLNPFSFDDIKKSFSGPCEFVGVLPWFDPPRHDTPEQKYEIVKKLQELKHICRMTGDGCSPALKRANIGIAVSAATDAGRGTSDIVLTKP
ncbi:hypothetical protein YC2023_065350 [Brassica napus]